MRIRLQNRTTGRPYRQAEPLEYMPWLYACTTMFGKIEFVSHANLVRR